MFEEEAEEYVNKDTWLFETAKQDAKYHFQNGAEFGYNKAKVEVEDSYRESLCNSELNLASVTEQLEELEKANEWHYIKDGILPKENKNVLIYSNRANYIGFYRNGFWFTNGDGCLEDDDIEVVAWKEIVPPKIN